MVKWIADRTANDERYSYTSLFTVDSEIVVVTMNIYLLTVLNRSLLLMHVSFSSSSSSSSSHRHD